MMFTRTSRVKTKEKGDSFEYAINCWKGQYHVKCWTIQQLIYYVVSS